MNQVQSTRLRLQALLGGCVFVAGCASSPSPSKTTPQPPAEPPAAAAAGPLGAMGTSPEEAKEAKTPRPAEKPEPKAMEALKQMGAFLRSLNEFGIKAYTATDEVLDNGQKIQFTGTVNLLVKRPDRLKVVMDSDRKEREFFYDGKTFTVYGKRNGYYASIEAPPTLTALIDKVEAHYGVEFPLVDLFYWGTSEDGSADIQSAIDLGPSTVAAVDTEHYAFRQKDVDWQLWIQRGVQPLPRKLVITTTSEPTAPQHSVVMAWDLAPKFTDETFHFVPPPDAKPIVFEDMTPRTKKP